MTASTAPPGRFITSRAAPPSSRIRTRSPTPACLRQEQRSALTVLDVAGIRLIQIDMHLQPEPVRDPDQHVVERDAPHTADPHADALSVAHPQPVGVRRMHMNMPRGANHAPVDPELSPRP